MEEPSLHPPSILTPFPVQRLMSPPTFIMEMDKIDKLDTSDTTKMKDTRQMDTMKEKRQTCSRTASGSSSSRITSSLESNPTRSQFMPGVISPVRSEAAGSRAES